MKVKMNKSITQVFFCLKALLSAISFISCSSYEKEGSQGREAFNGKEAILTGKGNLWEVKIPINYFYNQRENKNGITETV